MNKIIFQALCREISFLIQAKGRAVLAIDGKAAAGKSSFASELAGQFTAPVIHMDDFFLPPELRTEERYAQPGGNIHYERFGEEVLPLLREPRPFSYRRFDCHTMDYAEIVSVPDASLRIVEGAYALHPSFGKYYDLALFVDVEEGKQFQRIAARDGQDMLPVFRDRWIPYENQYIEACRVIDRCDHIIEY